MWVVYYPIATVFCDRMMRRNVENILLYVRKQEEQLPECFADHILISDAVVGQGLTPDRVEGVTQGLGAQLVGLCDRQKGK